MGNDLPLYRRYAVIEGKSVEDAVPAKFFAGTANDTVVFRRGRCFSGAMPPVIRYVIFLHLTCSPVS